MTATTRPDREALLEALLTHVPFDGWGPVALGHAARDLGLDPTLAAELFPGGAADQVAAFAAWADRRMLGALKGQDLGSLKVRHRVALALRTRFELLAPYKEAVRRGLTHFALPQNAPAGLATLHRTADAVWNLVGDGSTDHNWYSKRLLLAGVLSAATLYWLDDRSEGHTETWSFLDRQIDRVMQIGGQLGKGMNRLLSLPDRLLQTGLRGRRRFGA